MLPQCRPLEWFDHAGVRVSAEGRASGQGQSGATHSRGERGRGLRYQARKGNYSIILEFEWLYLFWTDTETP